MKVQEKITKTKTMRIISERNHHPGGRRVAEGPLKEGYTPPPPPLKFHPKHEKRKQKKTLTKRTNRH